jgi:pSer/pThr/pTyr-binding forkhead associated (FHA) protein
MANKTDNLPNVLPNVSKSADAEAVQPLPANLQGRTSIVIGRGVECDVVIKDVKASRRHCRLTRGESGFVLEDLQSKNGTYVNGERIQAPVPVKPSETFKVGDTVFYLAP